MATASTEQSFAQDESIAARFQRLAATWHEATDHLSSMSAASSHPSYQEIISLGKDVVPLMLRDLQDNQTHWFVALRTITGAQPIPAAAAGNIVQMAQAWLQWAKDNGYRW